MPKPRAYLESINYENTDRCQSQQVAYNQAFVKVAQSHAKSNKLFGINMATMM
jgi:hypothetical protein